MIRIVQIALLIAIIVPFGMLVSAGHGMLPNEAKWLLAGIPIGVGLSMFLDKWDRSIRQREGAGRRGD